MWETWLLSNGLNFKIDSEKISVTVWKAIHKVADVYTLGAGRKIWFRFRLAAWSKLLWQKGHI